MIFRVRDNFRMPFLAALAAAAFLVAPVSSARAQYRLDVLPQGYGQDLSMPKIVDKSGSSIPLDLEFINTDGQKVQLGSFFNHGKPVIVSMVYFSCPFMCGESQNQLAQTVVDAPGGLLPGKDYDVVVISIDPDDPPADAKQKHDRYANMMNLKPGDSALTYLTGSDSNI